MIEVLKDFIHVFRVDPSSRARALSMFWGAMAVAIFLVALFTAELQVTTLGFVLLIYSHILLIQEAE